MDTSEKDLNSNSVLRRRKRKGAWAVFSCFNGGLSLSDEETNIEIKTTQMVVPVEDATGMKRTEELNLKKNLQGKSKTKTTITKTQQPLPNQEPSICHVASKLKTPATLYSPSPEPGPRYSSSTIHGPLMRLCILTLALALMILGGGIYAVTFMCLWICLLHVLRNNGVLVPLVRDGTGPKGSEELVDVNSVEHKKMVVLNGFLNRDRRKLADKIRDHGGL